MPDFEDQIAAAGFLQQPDRRIGIDFDHRHGVRHRRRRRRTGRPPRPEARARVWRPWPAQPPSRKAAASITIVPPALRFIRPGMSRRSPFASTVSSEGSSIRRRDRREAAGAQGVVMGRQQFAQRMHAVAAHERRIFARAIQSVIVEQENPVLDALDDRLHQHRVVIFCDLVEIARERGFAVNRLRKIAARSRQRFYKRRSAKLAKICQRIVALMAGWAMRAIALMQEEIFAADRQARRLAQGSCR